MISAFCEKQAAQFQGITSSLASYRAIIRMVVVIMKVINITVIVVIIVVVLITIVIIIVAIFVTIAILSSIKDSNNSGIARFRTVKGPSIAASLVTVSLSLKWLPLIFY